MKEIHGIADARKVKMVRDEQTLDVTIEDGYGEVVLRMDGTTYPAALTPDRARYIARQLQASAARVEKAARSVKILTPGAST